MKTPKQILYITFGTIFLGLGTLGIFLPLLPTTPFWLLTSWLYLRSSEKLYNRAMANKYFGSYMKSFIEDRAIPLRAKIMSVSLLWITITCSALFFVNIIWVKILLFCIAIGVTWHILSFPTKKA
ncbi:MAG: YbaN family protein [Tannerellaceae bacterium]|nr:YbaN family protein [Tannerellaceae bacterium]